MFHAFHPRSTLFSKSGISKTPDVVGAVEVCTTCSTLYIHIYNDLKEVVYKVYKKIKNINKKFDPLSRGTHLYMQNNSYGQLHFDDFAKKKKSGTNGTSLP